MLQDQGAVHFRNICGIMLCEICESSLLFVDMSSIQKKMQVFVSSTYEDMKNERQAAVMAILDAGHIPAGMELFAANNKTQWKTIEKWIEESDVFLLILGRRYGTIEETTGMSYIELEFDHAVKIEKPFFSVVISDKARDDKARNDGLKVVEQDNTEKMKKFRKKVCGKMVNFYTDEKDIALAIHKSLSNYANDNKIGGWIRNSDINNTDNTANQQLDTLEQFDERLKKVEQEKGGIFWETS
jgi:hypothetical protein